MTATTTVIFLVLAVVTSEVLAQLAKGRPQASQKSAEPEKGKAGKAPPQPKVKLGLSINDPKAFRGYTLLNPMNKKTAYLIDMEGRVVKTWESEHNSMQAAYLLENGHLFRLATLAGEDRAFGGGPGAAGRIQEFDWDGELVWDFKFHNDKQFPITTRSRCPTATCSWSSGTRRPPTRRSPPGERKSWSATTCCRTRSSR